MTGHHRPGGFNRGDRNNDTHNRGSEPVPSDADDEADRLDTDGEPDTSQSSQPRPQQLSRDAQRRLQAARLWIAANRPYYSKAVFSCPVIAVAAPTRVGIDEQWRIYANSAFLESLTVKRAAVELIHLLNHALRDHAPRARNTGVDAITAPIWNAATDCEINDDLCEDDLFDDDLIDEDNDWLYPEDFVMDDFMPAEHYYRHLLGNSAAVPVRIECGSGCHSHHLDHELDTDTEALSNLDRTLLKRVVAVVVADHQKTHGTGSVPEPATPQRLPQRAFSVCVQQRTVHRAQDGDASSAHLARCSAPRTFLGAPVADPCWRSSDPERADVPASGPSVAAPAKTLVADRHLVRQPLVQPPQRNTAWSRSGAPPAGVLLR